LVPRGYRHPAESHSLRALFNPGEFEVSVHEGVVEISGVMELRSHEEILVDFDRGLEGVVDVRPALSYRLGDRNIAVPTGWPTY
jgi:hypothetical protein